MKARTFLSRCCIPASVGSAFCLFAFLHSHLYAAEEVLLTERETGVNQSPLVDVYEGMPLLELIVALQQNGINIIYSRSQVTSEMLVDEFSSSPDPVELLRQSLRPHSLRVDSREGGTLVIVVEPQSLPPQVVERASTLGSTEVPIDEILIVGSHRATRKISASVDLNEHNTLGQIPALSTDIFNLVRVIPGAVGDDFSASTRIRGGRARETKLELDGFTILRPFHLRYLRALSSVIDPEIIDSANVYLGNFTADVGGSASGLISLSTRDVADESSTALSLDQINFGIRHEHKSNAYKWLGSFRRGDLAIIKRHLPFNRDESAGYYDVFNKVSFDRGRTSFIWNILATHNDEVYRTANEWLDARTADFNSWLRASTEWSDRLNSESMFFLRQGSSNRIGALLDATGVVEDNSFQDIGFEQDWSYQSSSNYLLSWGWEWQHRSADFDYLRHQLPVNTAIGSAQNVELQGHALGFYGSGRFQPGESLFVEAGLRWDQQTYLEDNGQQISPRINLLYQPSHSHAFRLGWGKYYQAQELFQLRIADGETELSGLTEAEHTNVSYDYWFAPNQHFRVEGYFKNYEQLPAASINLLANIDTLLFDLSIDRINVNPPKGKTYGIEATYSVDYDKWRWFLGYSYARVFVTGDEQGSRTSLQDQPHTLKSNAIYRLNEHWEISTLLSYHTGHKHVNLTAIEEAFNAAGTLPLLEFLANGEASSGKFEDYLRVDIGLQYQRDFPRHTLAFSLGVLNVFSQKNPDELRLDGNINNIIGPSVFQAEQSGLLNRATPQMSLKIEF